MSKYNELIKHRAYYAICITLTAMIFGCDCEVMHMNIYIENMSFNFNFTIQLIVIFSVCFSVYVMVKK